MTVQVAYPKQHNFVVDTNHFAALVAGIGAGKTHAGTERALLAAYGCIGATDIPTPNTGVVTAPTYRMLQDATLETFREILGPRWHDVDFNKSEFRMTFPNGSKILFRSAEHPDRLRGPTITWWYGDEAALYRERVWRIMVGRLRQFGQLGYSWLTTTPRGKDWIYKLFAFNPRPGYRLHRATSADNIHLAREIITEWESTYSGDELEQELMGKFISNTGLVYFAFDYDTHVLSDAPTKDYTHTIAGVDWGDASPSVMLVGGTYGGDDHVYIAEEFYQRNTHIDEFVSIAKDMTQAYGIKQIVCDPSEPEYINKFVEAGLPAIAANNSVKVGIQNVKRRIGKTNHRKQPALTLAPGCANTIKEFEQYRWKPDRDGLSSDTVVKAHDHAMDALRYLVMELDESSDYQMPRATVESYQIGR